MGMSASQARLIALTARMNDIEYQGQQINQQRTTLSNQVNELYNSLLDMSVPTPPSQTDYSKTVYSGTTGATKFTMGTVRPNGNDGYNIDLSYTMAGDSISKTNKTKSLVPNTPTLNYTDATSEALNKVFNTVEETTYTRGASVTESVATSELTKEEANEDIMIATTVGNAKNIDKLLINGYADASGKQIDSLDGLSDNTTVYILANRGDVAIDGVLSSLAHITDGKIDNVNKVDSTKTETVISTPKIGYTSNDTDANTRVKNLGFYTYEGEPGADTVPVLITTVDGLKDAIQKNKVVKQGNGDIQLKNTDYAQEGVCDYLVKNGDSVTPLYSLGSEQGQEALAKCDTSLARIVDGIRHSFNISENDMSDETLLSTFSIYLTKSESGEYTPNFIRNKEITSANGEYTNIPSYEYSPSGTYTQSKSTDNCKLEFDASGRITKIGIPNNYGDYDWVDLTVSTEVDNEAYEEAMKDYNYEKIQYDKTQEEINLKTSIVQQQDKNLELKLTRLDNERNAVNTEIDAVKKVVSDNIEKSYKTFSG